MNFAAPISSMIRANRRGSSLLLLLIQTVTFVTLPLSPVLAHQLPQNKARSRSAAPLSCKCACRTRGDGICRCACCKVEQEQICTCGFSSRDEEVAYTSPARDATLPDRSVLAHIVLFEGNMSPAPSALIFPTLKIPTPPPRV